MFKDLLDVYVSELRKHIYPPNVIEISDLTRCWMRWKISREYGEFLEILNRLKPATILGYLVHRGAQEILKERYGDKIKNEFEVKTKIKGYTIIGRIDCLIERDEGEFVIVEIKSGRSVFSPPSPHHALQAWFYKLLLKKELGIDAEPRIAYITFAKLTEVEVTPEHIKDALKSLSPALSSYFDVISDPKLLEVYVDWWLSAKASPLFDWECKGDQPYCDYVQFCPKRIEKPRKE